MYHPATAALERAAEIEKFRRRLEQWRCEPAELRSKAGATARRSSALAATLDEAELCLRRYARRVETLERCPTERFARLSADCERAWREFKQAFDTALDACRLHARRT